MSRAPTMSSIPRPAGSRTTVAAPMSTRTFALECQPDVVASRFAGHSPNGATPARYPGTKLQLVAGPPPVSASSTQWPAVQTSEWEFEVTTVAEQTSWPGASPPARVKKTLPCRRPGKLALASLTSSARPCSPAIAGGPVPSRRSTGIAARIRAAVQYSRTADGDCWLSAATTSADASPANGPKRSTIAHAAPARTESFTEVNLRGPRPPGSTPESAPSRQARPRLQQRRTCRTGPG